MRVTIFGATGGIGAEVLAQAVAAGHDVTAVVRDPSRLAHPARAVTMDLTRAEPGALATAVSGADAVLSGLGPRRIAEPGVASAGTRAIVAAMKSAQVRRIVVVSAAPIGTVPSPARPDPPAYDPGDTFLMRHLMSPLIKRILRGPYADLALMEDVLRESELDWTIVRPPRLTFKPRTGRYRVQRGQNVRGGMAVSRADVADLMLRVLGQPDTVHQTLGIAN